MNTIVNYKTKEIVDIDENRDYSNEEWKMINIRSIKPVYYVSNMGRIKNISTDKILHPYLSNKGYLLIKIPDIFGTYQCITVHRLVLSAFTDEIEKIHDDRFIVNHIDGIKHHSYLSNLEWVTYAGNYEHALNNNLMGNTGTGAYNNVHSEEEVRAICELLSIDKISYRDIASRLGVNYTPTYQKFITKIATGSQWKSISKDYNFKRRHN